MNKIYAPFTNDQVELLVKHQLNREVHPYTCSCESNAPMIVSTYGFKCLSCGYIQNWAFDHEPS